VRRGNPTYSDIVEATNAAVRVFEAQGTRICAVGGLACRLLGNPRTPNDVDLLVLDTTSSQEQIKRVLVDANSRFYLIPARSPLATYKVLWYRTALDIRVKVDLLQPGIMSIPNVLPSDIVYKNSQDTGRIDRTQVQIPIAPFGLVLLLKLQAWEQHRDSSEFRFQNKQYTDSRDIDTLLPLAVASHVTFDDLPAEFLQKARERVISYTQTYAPSRQSWKRLGFKVTEPPPVASGSYNRTSAGRYSRQTASAARGDDLTGLFSRMSVAGERRGHRVDSRDWRSYDSQNWYDYD